MTEGTGWVSTRYSPQDAEDCLQLLRRLSVDGEPAPPACRAWERRQGPAGEAIAALARETGSERPVGAAMAVPLKVRLSGKLRTAELLLDPVVDPDYPNSDIRVGLLSDVCSFSTEEGIAFSYGFPGQDFLSTLVNKGGFRDIGAVPLLIRPLNPERLALKTTGSPVLGKTASIAKKIWRTPPSAPPQAGPPGLEMVEVDSFDDSFAVFWDRVQHRCPVMVVRDPAYLNWRYVDVPTREYTTFAARSDGKIRGFTVLGVAPLGRFSAGLILELLVETSAEGRAAGRLLLDQAYAYATEHDVDLLAALALRHTDESRLLRSRGFWVCPRFMEPRPFRLVVRCYDEEASPSRLAYDLRNWFVTMGDCDVL
jgi:GNAT superfamily N-acetyltransferase